MFCKNCGANLGDGQKFCTECGAKVEGYTKDDLFEGAKAGFQQGAKQVEAQFGTAFQEVADSLNGAPAGPAGYRRRLNDNRGLIAYIVLSFITCGIYSFYFIYTLAKDVNEACDGDGDTTPGLAAFILLSIFTCGIYTYYWMYKLGNRIQANGERYGVLILKGGSQILTWKLIGLALSIVGSAVGLPYFLSLIGYYGDYMLLQSANQLCGAYNRTHGL